MPGAVAETKSYLKGLDEFYRREIEPWLASREAERLAAIRRRWLIIGGGLVGAVGVFIAIYLVKVHHIAELHPLYLLLPPAVAIVAVIFGIRATGRLGTEVKAFLAEKLAAFFGFTYEADPTDDPTIRFHQLGLVPGHDRKTLEDHWSGAADGVKFSLVEATLEQERTRTNSKGNHETYHEIVFRGLLLALAFPRPFQGDILVRRDAGSVVNWFRKMFSSREPVRIDDADFDAKFDIFADDATEARRLLEPRLRLGIAAMAGDRTLTMAFSAGQVLLAVESPDRFELASLGHTLIDPERVRQMVADLGIVFDIIECLDLRPKA